MNPSVLAQQLQQAVSDYLRLSFETTTPFFADLLADFLKQPGLLSKGPYLSIKLPFEKGQGQANFFPDVPLGFPPHKHQDIAFQRLGVDFKSTLIATGTGSGKTECFQIPILNYCYQNRHQQGIKAILIYPMNALATDQAKRLAEAIFANPNLKGKVTAGLYVGDQEEKPTTFMGEKHLISDKETLRDNPPDILLTNYKMLDFLLIRAKDWNLWRHNNEQTLKYLVVDELHTFDGAQGTDLACLIRRLKARLGTPEQYLVCVGTSATLGGEQAGSQLITYASQIFAEPFDNKSVVSEYRQSLGEYLASSLVEHTHFPGPEQEQALAAENYADADSYAIAQAKLWFGDLQNNENSQLWRLELAGHLKKHFLFQNLLRSLNGQSVTDWQDLLQKFSKGLGIQQPTSVQFLENLLTSLVSLVAAAKDDSVFDSSEQGEGKEIKLRPLLDVRVQMWVRELSRLLVLLPVAGEKPRLLFSDDGVPSGQIALPVIHCRDCGAMGWLSYKAEDQQQLGTDLKQIYEGFFKKSAKSCFLFPMQGVDTPWNFPTQLDRNLCAACGYLSPRSEKYTASSCQSCGHEALIWVHLPNTVRTVINRTNGQSNNESQNICPFCESKGSLLIVGARAASLSSILVGQLSTSKYNPDKQLIAFSDAVQDSAHRAGFIAARTRPFAFRVALKRLLDLQFKPRSLQQLIAEFNQSWPQQLGRERFIGLFLPADMEWLRDFTVLKQQGKLPENSNLLALLYQRLAFDMTVEFGFRARIGRSLERSGAACCYLAAEIFSKALTELLAALQEQIGGLRALTADNLQAFVLGFLAHLRIGGGIYCAELESYLKDNANPGVFIRQVHLANFAPNARVPTFLASKKTQGFETVSGNGWYQAWLLKSLFAEDQAHLSGDISAAVYHLLLQQLVKASILMNLESVSRENIWAINPAVLLVSTKSAHLRCNHCHHQHTVAEIELERWQKVRCLRKFCLGIYQLEKEASHSLDFYGRLYRDGDINRVVAAEHTGLLSRDERAAVEKSFKESPETRQPWDVNLLSATPTLEMGVDIGDLSSVLLCSVPPAQANYLQRIGRAGRRDGNAINITLANAAAHDLYFYAEPKEIMAGAVQPPGVFLDASAVLERQYMAFCLDQWVKQYAVAAVIPYKLEKVLNAVAKQKRDIGIFPYSFLSFVELNRSLLIAGFFNLFTSVSHSQLSQFSIAWIKKFAEGDFNQQGSLSFRIEERLMQQHQELESLKKEAKRVNTATEALKKAAVLSPQDKENLQQFATEFEALVHLANRIKHKDTLQFFTDEGLIPNYAFPEQGVN